MFLISLRSKRFRGVREQRKSEKRDFRCLPARKMVREPKRGKRGRGGEGRKWNAWRQTPGFWNLSCLSAHTKISCCHRLSELSRTYQDMSETTSSRNGEISINPSDQCSFWNCNYKINPSKSMNFKGEEVLALICQSGNTWQVLYKYWCCTSTGVWNPCDRKIRNLGSPYINTGHTG